MGLRSLERRLASEICYQVVAEVVDEYLRRSKEVGRLLNPVDGLKMPILREGFCPPGLHHAVGEIALLRPRLRRRVRRLGDKLEVQTVPAAAESQERSCFPDADKLIEKIFGPCPTERLRTARRRRHVRTFAAELGRRTYGPRVAKTSRKK